jgi:arsenate reductase
MPFKVLVLCTGNSARSILGEMLFRHLGAGRIKRLVGRQQARRHGQSGGAGNAGPARRAVRRRAQQVWDEFAAPGAPEFDFIFTVCANAANETCPVWPGHPATAHWGIPDPAHVEPIEARREAFEDRLPVAEAKRIEAFLALPLETMTPQESALAARRIHGES